MILDLVDRVSYGKHIEDMLLLFSRYSRYPADPDRGGQLRKVGVDSETAPSFRALCSTRVSKSEAQLWMRGDAMSSADLVG